MTALRETESTLASQLQSAVSAKEAADACHALQEASLSERIVELEGQLQSEKLAEAKAKVECRCTGAAPPEDCGPGEGTAGRGVR